MAEKFVIYYRTGGNKKWTWNRTGIIGTDISSLNVQAEGVRRQGYATLIQNVNALAPLEYRPGGVVEWENHFTNED